MKTNARMKIFLFLTLFLLSSVLSVSKQVSILKGARTGYPNQNRTSLISSKSLDKQNFDKTISSVSSTIVFEEDFENGFPPAGWKTVNVDGGGTTPPWFQGNTSIFTAYNGNGYAAANYQGANDFYIDQWLISPQILSVSSDDTLLFWHRSPDYSAWDDSLEVRISTTDTAISSFTIKVDYFKTSTYGWSQNKYILKNYVPAGSNIYIAFRYLLYDGGISGLSSNYVGIDLVQIVKPQVENDIKAASIDYPLNDSKVLVGQTISPIVTFKNVGLVGQFNIPVKLRITSPLGISYEDTATIPSLLPGQSQQITFKDFASSSTGIHTVIAYSMLSTDDNKANDSLKITFREAVLVSGIYSVGIGGMIPTIRQAVDTLNHNIISNDVLFSLIDSEYNEPPLSIGPLDYSFIINRVTFKPAADVSPLININSTPEEPFGVAITGASKIIIDGSATSGNTRNMTIKVNGPNGRIGILIHGNEEALADSNTIKNLVIQTSADSNSNSDGYNGILLYGYDEAHPDAGNTVFNCDIQKFGSVGIASQWETGLLLDRNTIHDWIQTAGENDIHGMWLAEGTKNSVVRNNIIGNIITKTNYSWAYGIELSPGSGSNSLVYNNMIYNIASTGGGTTPNFSIAIYSSNISNNGDTYCYNSIYMSGTDSSTNSSSRSAGFEFVGGTNITLKNNIVFNSMSLLGSSNDNKSYCVYLSVLPVNFISNNNDFYVPGSQGVIGYNSGNRITLSDWQNSFSPIQDNLSISSDPLFISPNTGDLHIQTNTLSPVNSAGTPISGILVDIDGMMRNPITPDIGADEFIPGASTINIECIEGWNLISVPLMVEDYHKTSLFPTAISDAFSFKGSYVIENVLRNGSGYWLKFNSPQIIEIAGDPILVDTLNVVEGWNLIGTITDTVQTNSIIQIPDGIVISPYYTYDGFYSQKNLLIPGKGYWVKSKQNGMLILRKE